MAHQSVKIRAPERIGYFSRDRNGNYLNNDSSQKFLLLDRQWNALKATLPLDLSIKAIANEYIPFNEEIDTLPKVLMWMRNNPSAVWNAEDNEFKDNFYMDGKTLKHIILARNTTVRIRKFCNSFFVWPPNKQNMDQNQADQYGFAGNKFELALTTSKEGGRPTSVNQVNENLQFYHVNSTNVGAYKLVYASNIDCMFKKEVVEICLCHEKKPEEQERFAMSKLQEYYVKAYLSGAKKTICGYRDDTFQVNAFHTFETKDICKSCKKYWTHNQVFSILKIFCDQVSEKIDVDSCLYNVTVLPFKAEQNNSSRIIIKKAREEDEEKYKFPPWFDEDYFAKCNSGGYSCLGEVEI